MVSDCWIIGGSRLLISFKVSVALCVVAGAPSGKDSKREQWETLISIACATLSSTDCFDIRMYDTC